MIHLTRSQLRNQTMTHEARDVWLVTQVPAMLCTTDFICLFPLFLPRQTAYGACGISDGRLLCPCQTKTRKVSLSLSTHFLFFV